MTLRRLFGVLAATILTTALFAAVAPAAQAGVWVNLGCRDTVYKGAKICIYRSSSDPHRAQGRFINNSSVDIYNRGAFYRQNSTQTAPCGPGGTTTEAGDTSYCTKELTGTWSLGDTYEVNDGFRFISTVAVKFG